MGNCSAASIGLDDDSDDSIDCEAKDDEQQPFVFNDLNGSMEGFLQKKSKHIGSWRNRWTILNKNTDKDQFMLQTFKTKEMSTNSKPTTSILINHEIEIETKESNLNEFIIYHKPTKISYIFKAPNDKARDQWLNVLKQHYNDIHQYEDNQKYKINIINDDIIKMEVININNNKIYTAFIEDKLQILHISAIKQQKQSDIIRIKLNNDQHNTMTLTYFDDSKSLRQSRCILLKQDINDQDINDQDINDQDGKDEEEEIVAIKMGKNKESYKEYEFKFKCDSDLFIEIKHLKSKQIFKINIDDEYIKNKMKLKDCSFSDLFKYIQMAKQDNLLKIELKECSKLAQILHINHNNIELTLDVNNEQYIIDLQQETLQNDDEKSENKDEEAYKEAIISLSETSYGQYCSIEGLSSRSAFNQHKNDKADPLSANMKKIMKEIRKDLAKNIFLSYNNGSMFVRFDESNPRFLQAMLIGLQDTPYFNGCFLFDIYLSNDYPVKPPQIKHTTNGASLPTANNGPGGFSPNLHKSTGKVCLSLLGTWSGPGWQPNKSNVYQILSTLLFMVFAAKHPYYMEPNHGGWEGTINNKKQHDTKVIQYDEELLYHTAKSTILDIIKKPYIGFEDVIKTHFKFKSQQIIDHNNQVLNNKDYSNTFKDKIRPIYQQIKQQLEKL